MFCLHRKPEDSELCGREAAMTCAAVLSTSFCQTQTLNKAVLAKYSVKRSNEGRRPMTGEELINVPKFLCTPHIGGSAAEARLAMGGVAMDAIEDNFIPDPGVFSFV